MEYISVIQCQYLLRLQRSKVVIIVKLIIVSLMVYTTMDLKITELQEGGLIKEVGGFVYVYPVGH